MLEDNPTDQHTDQPTDGVVPPAESAAATTKKAATKKKAAARKKVPTAEAIDSVPPTETPEGAPVVAKRSAAKKQAAKKTTTAKAAAKKTTASTDEAEPTDEAKPARKATAKKATAKKATAKKAPTEQETAEQDTAEQEGAPSTALEQPTVGMVVFQAPEPVVTPARRGRAAKSLAAEPEPALEPGGEAPPRTSEDEDESETSGAPRRRRRRGGRRRRKAGDGQPEPGAEPAGEPSDGEAPTEEPQDEAGDAGTRRRRRRRRAGEEDAATTDGPNTVTRVRQTRSATDQITAVSGSTRLEAKKQRRREGREAGRRRAPIVSEAEFLARRESVERVMAIRQRNDLTQIAVLEDKVLVEHYVSRESQTSLIGNIYLGRVQNVLPSMEAAFIDIGRGRNAVLYAGEVNWSALGHQEGTPRKIESVLTSGQPVLVQVTKDPVGHKGARLTSQISLAGRFLVYVPDGTTSGISRKLPDTERNRLKTLLKEIVPDTAGVIVRTAAEGAAEDELTRDVERLKARWEDVERKAKGSAPQLLYGEPDLTLKVVRDLFTEDFSRLVIEGDDAWETVSGYVTHVAPDLEPRLERFVVPESGVDVFAAFRIDEQIAKGLDRKVWLPSGGSLIIDRTEAMTVVDVNTGKFTGSGGNLEETVTKNNLEAAEEIVRQLRLRDIGGIIVVDFIDMVLESNRDLVVRRLVECLGRDRTRHQVAEVTSLGLVQMTRKRIGTGLLEAFSHSCEHCAGRGVILHEVPVEPRRSEDDSRRGGRRGRGGRGRPADSSGGNGASTPTRAVPSPKDLAAVARPEPTPTAEPVSEAETAPEPAAGPLPEPDAGPASAPEPKGQAAPPIPALGAGPDARPALQAPPAPEPESDPTAAPEQPRVVTRTRRRSASRPAGPPPVVAAGDPSSAGPDEAGAADVEGSPAESAEDPHIEHVPIKRKGTRKR